MSSRQHLKNDPDEEMKESEQHRGHKKSKHSSRKRGRDDSDSDDSEDKSRDVDERHKKSKHVNEANSDDELDDDDEEEDYDDEEDSHGSFIAPDDVVEQELLDERAREKHESRRKKRKERSYKLEDDDYDLIQDNTGMKVQKPARKRLTKQSEKEKFDEQVEIGRSAQKAPVKSEADLEMADDYQSDEEAFRQKDRQTRDQQVARKKAQVQDPRSNEQQDQSRMQVARHIFEDTRDIAGEIAARKNNMQGEKQFNDISALFDGDEIDDQFATKADKIITEKDIPERLQLKLGEYEMPTEDDLMAEADWISERMFQEQKRKEMMYNSAHVKKKIQQVLNLFKVEHLDIPMITKYRRFEYMKELDEQDVWTIFNLDLEYTKYIHQKTQIVKFIKKIQQFNPELRVYEDELHFVKNQTELNDFSNLITFLKSYYVEELAMLPQESKKRVPGRTDLVQNARKYRLDEFARQCMLRPQQFVENLQHNSFVHQPPEIHDKIPINLAQEYFSDVYNEEIKVFSGVCTFVSHELAAQPYIRAQLKREYWKHGTLTTKPTEQGQKDIDIFHPSYKIKRIQEQPLEEFKYDDRFLDILQNEKAKLITLTIEMEKEAFDNFYKYLESLYITQNENNSLWNIMRKEVLRKLHLNILYPDITKEITNELKDYAENYIISKCKDKYRNLLMTGPFTVSDNRDIRRSQQDERGQGKGGKISDDDIIKDRPRLNVMGVVLQQIDNNNSAVTVAVVDKYGELIAHKDLLHLMPPRKPKNNQRGDDPDQGRNIQQTAKSEEEKEHEKDREKIMDMIMKHSVDLIVVGANKLEARKIKETLKDIADKMKSFGSSWKNEDDARRSKGSRQGDIDERKEAIVIWGSLEIPKLFSRSHQSTKLLKNCHPILKQAVSLARFEQDPMSEILNLWSSVPSENQILSCNLHPLQKQLNQAKLADSLEEVSVQCVNEVGADLNVLVDHDYLHATLQFVSGLGPRKARKLIQKIKSTGKKITTRGEIFKDHYLYKFVFMSAIAFLKIRCPADENTDQFMDLLDQTRIHQESYMIALKVACDVLYDQQEMGDRYQQYKAVKEIIMNPHKLKNLDIKKYNSELEQTGQANMTIILDLIIEELQNPFKDPREYRTPTKLQIDNPQLFYMLIDESERTFKRGIIVTATVIKVLEKKVYSKLDNGLDAIIFKEDLMGKNSDDSLYRAIQPGHVISGRISEIKLQQESNFSVTLNCKRKALENHEEFIPSELDKKYIHPDDLINSNFQIEKKEQKQARYQSRRINHPKFKNISSIKALQELQDKDIGEFMFRPSSKGPDNITLTWKFYTNNIVHMDIEELEKPVGASIGNKLKISEELFESLQEIIDRYIIPCNRNLREVINHIKFMQCHSQEDMEAVLKQEKVEEPNKIPYRFTILEKYPQHVVLGYIPRTSLVKEYIKIKPRGYYFHANYHNPFQHLINWFKEKFKSSEYLKAVRKQRSPRVKTAVDNSNVRNPRGTPSQDYEGSRDYRRSAANSVHSMNDDNMGDNQTPLIMKTEHNWAKQTEYGAHEGQTTGTAIGGFSDYNQNNSMSNSNRYQSDGQRGRSDTCYICKETGHISKDCPNKDRQRSSRPPRDREEGGYQRQRQGENGDYQQSREDNNVTTHAPYKSPAENWGADNSLKQENNAPRSPWGPKTEGTPKVAGEWPVENPGGWGSKTPQRNDTQPSWGPSAGQTSEQWGNQADNNNDNDYDRRNSPARSQKSYDDNRGERGRGRGGRGRGGMSSGGSRACYKCQEEGHMARECPKGDSMPRDMGRGRGGGGRGACYKCHEEGHMARECPNPDTNDRGRGGRGRGGFGGGGRQCFKCNQEGHMARECPNEQDDRNSRPYKRQKREDGGSVRRDNEDNSTSNAGDWNQGASGWDNNQGNSWNGGGAVQASVSENNAWGQQTNNNNNSAAANETGGWESLPSTTTQPQPSSASWN